MLDKGNTFGFNDVEQLDSPVVGLEKLPIEAEGLSRLERLSPASGGKPSAICSRSSLAPAKCSIPIRCVSWMDDLPIMAWQAWQDSSLSGTTLYLKTLHSCGFSFCLGRARR